MAYTQVGDPKTGYYHKPSNVYTDGLIQTGLSSTGSTDISMQLPRASKACIKAIRIVMPGVSNITRVVLYEGTPPKTAAYNTGVTGSLPYLSQPDAGWNFTLNGNGLELGSNLLGIKIVDNTVASKDGYITVFYGDFK